MEEKVPEEDAEDMLHGITRTVFASIPILGGPATEIFGNIVTRPVEKRRVEWLNDLADRLKRLEEIGALNFDKLSNDPKFLNVIIKATEEALKTSSERKLEALKNTVLNTSINASPEDAKCQMFLNHIQAFTEWHLRVLELIDDPRKLLISQGIDPEMVQARAIWRLIGTAYPVLKPQEEFVKNIWRDLYNAGLINTDEIHTMMTVVGVLTSRTTEYGKELLSFISSND